MRWSRAIRSGSFRAPAASDESVAAADRQSSLRPEERVPISSERPARSRLSRVRTFVKNVESAIETGDKNAAQSAFNVAQPELHRATTKGVLHRNTVARKLSRLAARINAL